MKTSAQESVPAAYLFVVVVGLGAGAVSGVIGTGSSIMLLPIFVIRFGPKQAVPIMAIAALMSNVGKGLAWRREIDWRPWAAYSITVAPAAARTLLVLPSHVLDVALALFSLAMILVRRRLAALAIRLGLWHLAFAGAVIGFLTGLFISTGPLSVPAFTLSGGPSAHSRRPRPQALAMMVSKVAKFRRLGALPSGTIVECMIIGESVTAGAFVGKAIARRMSIAIFEHVLDALLLASGPALLWAAFR